MAQLEQEKADLEVGGQPAEVRHGFRGRGAAWAVFAVGALLIGAAVGGNVSEAITEEVAIALAVAGGSTSAFAVSLGVVSSLLVVVPPNTLVVLTGRRYYGPDGSQRGHRVVSGGRVMPIPLLERVDTMSTALMWIEADVRSVHARRARIDLRYRLGARVSRTEPGVSRAVERFLGAPREDIERVARECFEGVARSVVAKLTLDELAADRASLTSALVEELERELEPVGLEVDALSISDIAEA